MANAIKGFMSNMTFLPYPKQFVAPDGTAFQAIRLYDVAGRNIGVLRTNPDGSREVYGNTLYAVPDIAEKRAKECCDGYTAAMN